MRFTFVKTNIIPLQKSQSNVNTFKNSPTKDLKKKRFSINPTSPCTGLWECQFKEAKKGAKMIDPKANMKKKFKV